MAGLGAARMVAPALAKLLIKKGIGKQVSKGVGRPISKVDDLPATAQKMFKSPKAVADQKSSVKFAEEAVKRRSAGAKKAAATRATKPKTPEQIEAIKVNKALARGRAKDEAKERANILKKLDFKSSPKGKQIKKVMDEKEKLAMQAVTGKRKAGGKIAKRHSRNRKKVDAMAEKKKQDFLKDAEKTLGKASARQGRPRAAVRNIKASDVDKERSARIVSKKAEATRAKNNPKKKSSSTKLPVNLFPDGLPYESYKKESMINAKAGGKVKGYKKGGPITYRMSGGQVVSVFQSF